MYEGSRAAADDIISSDSPLRVSSSVVTGSIGLKDTSPRLNALLLRGKKHFRGGLNFGGGANSIAFLCVPVFDGPTNQNYEAITHVPLFPRAALPA